MRLGVSHGGRVVVVDSERAARRLAKELLGVTRLVETPTTTGWQYWRSTDSEDSADVVTIEVRS